MIKRFYLLGLCFLVNMMCVTSCFEEDASEHVQDNRIEINGTRCSLSQHIIEMGTWDKKERSGSFNIMVEQRKKNTLGYHLYAFDFSNSCFPKMGDDLGNAFLTLRVGDGESDLYTSEYTYQEGAVRVEEVDRDLELIRIRFIHLRMGNDVRDYTFHGIAVLPFSDSCYLSEVYR